MSAADHFTSTDRMGQLASLAARGEIPSAGMMGWKFGVLYSLAVPLAAPLAAGRGVSLGGLNYTGWMWVMMLVLGVFVVLIEKALHRSARIQFPYLPWACLFAYLWFSLVWSDQRGARNVQEALQLSMPLLMAVIGGLFFRSPCQLRRLLQAFLWSWLLLCVAVVAPRLGLLPDVDMEESVRAAALTAVLIGCVALGSLPARVTLALAGWTGCLLLTFVTGSRLATAALVVVPIMHPGYGRLWKRGLAVLVLSVVAVGLFYTPTFQQRFFYSGSGTLSDLFQGNVHTYGRLDAWPFIWDKAWQRPWAGHGIGSAYDYVPTIWPNIYYVHNDYLRVFYELGSIGFALFLAVFCWQIFDLRRQIHRSEGVTRHAFVACLLGMFAYLIAACADNPMVYNLSFTNPLFALMGAAYGTAYGAVSEDGQSAPRVPLLPAVSAPHTSFRQD